MSDAVVRRRVLIVDDERAVADSLALIFKMNGYEARTAYSAEYAIERIAKWQPDLAILDVVLPKMNGIDLAIVMKATHPDCQLLLFSGQPSTAEAAEEASRKGYAFQILAKPVHPTYLLDTAASLLSAATKQDAGRPSEAE